MEEKYFKFPRRRFYGSFLILAALGMTVLFFLMVSDEFSRTSGSSQEPIFKLMKLLSYVVSGYLLLSSLCCSIVYFFKDLANYEGEGLIYFLVRGFFIGGSFGIAVGFVFAVMTLFTNDSYTIPFSGFIFIVMIGGLVLGLIGGIAKGLYEELR